MHRGGQVGFTLVEVTIVMAISAMLLLVLLHQHQANGNAAFTGVIDQIQNELNEIKNQAYTSKNDSGSGNTTSGSNDTIEWGKGVIISGSTLTEYNLTATTNSNGITGIKPLTPPIKTLKFSWGITTSPSGSSLTVAFVRNPSTGNLEIYFPATSLTTLSDYISVPASSASISFNNPDGHTASVTIDPASQFITKSITP
jgi:prepilin-type N-terminal cleavage/methylation domain-containing protein